MSRLRYSVPYRRNSQSWQKAGANGGITDTSDVEVQAAVAGKCHYLCALQLANSDATVSTEVVVKDGSTVIWRGWVPALIAAVSQPPMVNIEFPVPLKGTANTALNIAAVTTSAQVIWSAQGYTE